MEKNNYKIQYLPSFDQELNKIIYYITYNLQNPKAAEKLLDNINKSIIDRGIEPEGYEKYKSKRNRRYIWYRIYVQNYVIFYTVKSDTIEIAHILYNKRNFNKYI